jgi:putative flippase GtrA
MNNFFSLLFRKSVNFRYLIIGFLNTIFSLLIFPLLYLLFKNELSLNYILGIAYICTFCFTFLAQKFLVYKLKFFLLREVYLFLILHLSIFTINIYFLPILLNIFENGIILTQLLFTLFILFLNFILSKYFIFKSS